MRRTLQVMLSYAITAGISALIVALPAVYPLLVVTVSYLIMSLMAVLGICAIAALAFVTFYWTRYRVGGLQVDRQLEAETARFANDIQTVVPGPSEIHDWRTAYERFAYIALAKQSMSFTTMRPYIATRKQVYWTWMKDQLILTGWAVEKDGITRFASDKPAVYRRFGLLVRRGDVVLLPHPQLPAPVISPWIQQFNTPNMANKPNMAIIENAQSN